MTRLGSQRFEHLVQALALDHIGPGVQVFGAGPDGGREATFDGEVRLEGKGTWAGYGVIQAKYRARLTGTREDQTWFFEQITAELDEWIKPTSKRRFRQPKYLVIATNVPLSAVAESGGIDRLEKLMTSYRENKDDQGNLIGLPHLVDHAVWHADYLDRLLENRMPPTACGGHVRSRCGLGGRPHMGTGALRSGCSFHARGGRTAVGRRAGRLRLRVRRGRVRPRCPMPRQ